MLKHLRTIETEEWRDGRLVKMYKYADPNNPDNWIDDPCSFCGGESFRAACPGDGGSHHHGGIHPPPDAGESGYWYLCKNPDCRENAEVAWAAYRNRKKAAR